MGALTFAPLLVLGLDEVDTGVSPLIGERIRVVHVHIDGSAADPVGIGAWSGEMDRQPVAMGERIPLVVVRGAEAQLLVVSDRTRYIRDPENRLDADDALHGEIIGGRLPASVSTSLQAVRSASIVAVSTRSETARASSLSDVMKASACSCVSATNSASNVVSHPS